MDTTRIAVGAVLVLAGAGALFFGATGIDTLPTVALAAAALSLTAGTLLIGTSGTPEENATRQV